MNSTVQKTIYGFLRKYSIFHHNFNFFKSILPVQGYFVRKLSTCFRNFGVGRLKSASTSHWGFSWQSELLPIVQVISV